MPPMPLMPLIAEAAVLPTGNDAGWVLGALSMILTAVFGYLNNRLKVQTDEKLKALEHDLKGCQDKHSASELAAKVALGEVAGLKTQNGEQQEAMNEQQGMINTLASRIVELVGALHASGIPTGSGPHAKLTDETGDHEPLAPKG